MAEEKSESYNLIHRYRERLENALDFADIWEIVKDSVKDILEQYRVGMMLFLADLPLRLGAYHPVGTNNIVMNRSLLEIVTASTNNRIIIKAFIYNILLHEYIHAIGYMYEGEVQPLVMKISQECFGSDHEVAHLARTGPWSILRGIPLNPLQAPKRVVEIVKNFEKSSHYIA